MKLGLVLISVLALSQVCLCFHEVPHMLVLAIAKKELMKNDMEVYNITAKYLDTYSTQGVDTVSTTTYEENAVWADDIKVYGDAQKAMEMWHYIGNKDSNPQNLTPLKKDPMADSENALNAYNNIVKVLTNEKFVGQMTEFKVNMLKMLVHIVGDIHMPHHTGSFYNATYKNDKGEFWGDLGGNRQMINFYTSTGEMKKTNIHFYFDSSCFFYTWTNRLVRPLNETFKIYFQRELDRIVAQYPKESLNIDNTKTFSDWADESWNLALNNVYPFLLSKNEIHYGDDFYNSSFDMIQKRIVTAGYRLAYTLQKLFTPEKGLIKANTPLSYQQPIANNNNNSINNQKDNTNQTLASTYESSDNQSNKAMAIVFGVLFGLTFVAFIFSIIYFKKTVSPSTYQRTSNDLIEAKNINVQKLASTENNL
ncbi:P1/s1 nuclease (macronuclear) [Tetrahymena thermophila SB210]|uniref:P1/s1 nuclease n=1 Tax=Tetrahymena thermophila (strain SB210) TaxID=312017 RepID=Q23AG7_TETTS|nr:P1/s1 nuclease [Tetrahymena thermophila SB210]EAR93525.3 P1/s1 nuclease [Tetrahymena thermophila SB210]|eukprot:XP_001013770.3 P1/s1 nuclease [Tetrahymena thermophila SB210]